MLRSCLSDDVKRGIIVAYVTSLSSFCSMTAFGRDCVVTGSERGASVRVRCGSRVRRDVSCAVVGIMHLKYSKHPQFIGIPLPCQCSVCAVCGILFILV